MIGSWCTDRSAGFTDSDLQALGRLQKRLAVAVKMRVKEKIASNILETYLGQDAGRKVLNGQIKRGDGQRIYSVLWYSDLKGSSKLADSMSGDAYIELLNSYFECTASAVLEQRGEILRFPGDAVLGIFPIEDMGASDAACDSALKAATEAFRRLETLNRERGSRGEGDLGFGIGLHIGEVLFGNIGVPERLEFSVIGPAMNHTARLEALTREQDAGILVSNLFVEQIQGNGCLTAGECRLVGEYCLHGIDKPMKVFEYIPG